MKFAYKSIDGTGQTHEGTREAESEFALAKELTTSGETLVNAREVTKASVLSHLNISFGGVKLAEKITFAKNLAAMVDAGLTISRGLSVMERETKSKKFKRTLSSLAAAVERGSALSEAMKQFPETFSSLFVSMVHAGEESGKLGESLRIVADQMDRTYSLRRKVRGAMLYPLIIVSVMIIIGILMLIFVVPTLTATFTELNVKLPAATRLVITLSDALKAYPVFVIGGLIVLIVALITLGRTQRGKRGFEYLIMRMPVIASLIRETNSARMARTFSSLLSSGVEVVSSIAITKDVIQNSYYKEVLDEAEADIQKGSQISSVFARHEKLFPPMVNEMVAVGEETGKLPAMLMQIALFFESEVEQKTKDMSTIIEPFLMVIIGAAVGFFAVSMIMPIYSISSGI
ncbi:MAG: type II secretion system F family protein [Patescibacteria group bacterium]